MNITISLRNIKEIPYILTRNGVVAEVSDQFESITEYKIDDLTSLKIEEALNILRFAPKTNVEAINEETDYFIFTKSLEYRVVNVEVIIEEDEQIYIFKEKPNSRFDEKFGFLSQLSSVNVCGVALYSVPDFVLLTANDMYLSFLESAYNVPENAFGKLVNEIFTGWENSSSEIILDKIIADGKSQHIKELEFDVCSRGITYRDITFVPLFENNKVKYVVINSHDVTERVLYRKQLEEKTNLLKQQNQIIKQQKEQLEAIVENMSDAVFIVDKDNKFILINQEARKKYFTKNETKNLGDGLNSAKFMDFDCKPLTIERLPSYRALHGERVSNFRCIIEHSGEQLVTDTNASPIYDNNGDISMAVVCVHDITKLIEKEKLIQQQKELLEATIENMNDAIAIYDNKGKIILTNAEARRLYPSVNPGTAVGNVHTGYQYFDLNNNTIPIENLPTRRVFKGERIKNERVVIKYPDRSRIIEINAVPVFDSDNNLISAVISHHDVSETVEYEKQLKMQNNLLIDVMNNIQENMWVFDKEGNIILADKKTREFSTNVIDITKHQLKLAKAYYINGSELSIEKSPVFRAIQGQTVENETIYYEYKGKRHYVINNGKTIFDEKGNFSYIVFCKSDITEVMKSHQAMKEMQEQLLISEREKNEALEKSMAMKDEFLSMISHELRTPLNVISTAMQAINYFSKQELSDRTLRYMAMIRQNTNRQLRLVNNLLDITRANAGHININKRNLDIVFLTKAITESVYTYAAQKGINLSFESSVEGMIIGLDDDKYERILLNLLSNAIKFTPDGKSIKIKLNSNKNNISIRVKDEGIGIPQEQIDIIFERFGQVNSLLSRRAEGAGIGLSLVKNFVQALGGSITVKSKLGKGSTFTILLPRDRVDEEENEAAATDLLDNNLVQIASVEFSDIYQ